MKQRRIDFQTILIVAIAYLFGLAFILIPNSYLRSIYYSTVSIIIIITGIFKITFSEKKPTLKETFSLNLIEGILNIIIGVVLFNFYNNYIVACIIFGAFVIIPLIKIITSKYRLNQFIIDIPKLFMAVTVLFSPKPIAKVFFIVIGIILLAISTIYIISKFLVGNKNKVVEDYEK